MDQSLIFDIIPSTLINTLMCHGFFWGEKEIKLIIILSTLFVLKINEAAQVQDLKIFLVSNRFVFSYFFCTQFNFYVRFKKSNFKWKSQNKFFHLSLVAQVEFLFSVSFSWRPKKIQRKSVWKVGENKLTSRKRCEKRRDEREADERGKFIADQWKVILGNFCGN
jgi:hypothetical protein